VGQFLVKGPALCGLAKYIRAKSHPEDYALVYLGQAQPYESEESSPCLILSGTSTLGTWGATVFTTSPYLLQRHVGYSP